MEPVIMPVLDMTMEQGVILRWLKRPGEPVRKGEPLFEVQTDKVNIEVESPADGVLLRILHPEGATVPVREVVAYIGAPGELPAGETEGAAAGPRAAGPVPGRVRATPSARRLARQLGIDLATVRGTGYGGAILAADVEAAARARAALGVPAAEEAAAVPVGAGEAGPAGQREAVAAAPAAPGRAPAAAPGAEPGVERVPVTGIRRAIAERMGASARVPQVTLFLRVPMGPLRELRRRLMPAIAEATGHSLSYTALFAYAVARTLPRFPELNAHFREREGEIWRFRAVHLGIATALPGGGLLVPVIRDADRLTLGELVRALAEVTGRAREGRLRPEDYAGATFTLSNLGMYGVEAFGALLDPPQVGILSVGAIVDASSGRPAEDAAHPQVTLGLTFDHRALDGAEAARYLQHLGEVLADPYRLFI